MVARRAPGLPGGRFKPYSNPAAQVEGAHPVGAMAVTWSPAAPPGSLVAAKGPGRPERRFASAGCDNTVKVRPR